MRDPDQPTKHVIVFRFCGGARDGKAIRSDKPDGAREVQTLWALTWNGTVGRRFDTSTAHGPAYERYQVKSKYESGDEIHVTCQYIG